MHGVVRWLIVIAVWSGLLQERTGGRGGDRGVDCFKSKQQHRYTLDCTLYCVHRRHVGQLCHSRNHSLSHSRRIDPAPTLTNTLTLRQLSSLPCDPLHYIPHCFLPASPAMSSSPAASAARLTNSDLPRGAPYSRLTVGINPFLYASSTPNHTTSTVLHPPPRSPQPPASPLSSPPSSPVLRFTNCRLCRSGRLIAGEDLWVTRGRVVDPAKRFWEAQQLNEFAADVTIDCHGAILTAGFIDIQINGAFGFDFTAPEPTAAVREFNNSGSKREVSLEPDVIAAGLDLVSVGLLRHGVTSFLPTVITSSHDTYTRLLPHYKARRGSPTRGANVLGVHCEGPFITRQGAHTQSLMRTDSASEECLEAMYGQSNMQHIRVITAAPEIEGMLAALDYVHRLYPHIVLSAGHSSASFDAAYRSTQHGVTLLTHLFNAMVPFTHRDPGIVGLIGTNDKRLLQSLHYSLITDDIHTHAASVRIAYQCHPSGCVVITDAMAAMGLPPSSEYHIGQQAVDVRVDAAGKRRALVRGGDVLAGSVATMDECVREMWKATGCSLVEALESGSLHAAEVLGERRKGRLDVDCDADVLLVDDELNVRGVWIGGEMAWVTHGAVTIKEAAV